MAISCSVFLFSCAGCLSFCSFLFSEGLKQCLPAQIPLNSFCRLVLCVDPMTGSLVICPFCQSPVKRITVLSWREEYVRRLSPPVMLRTFRRPCSSWGAACIVVVAVTDFYVQVRHQIEELNCINTTETSPRF